jgi:hypothetical protein
MFLVELLVLGDLFLQLGQGRLELWLLENLGLLVGIDLACSYQLIEGFARILSKDIVDFGGVCLIVQLV